MNYKKTAIITGCSKGIGKAILNLFSNNYQNIWACTRKKDEIFENYLINLSEQKKININNIYFDFANIENVIEAGKKIIAESENIDVLVNNAGVIQTSLFQMTKIENIKKIFEVNYFSQLQFTQIILKKMMKKRKGSIINISSTSSIDAETGRLSYSSSKSALATSSKVLSRELGAFNIRVNVIAPGLTDTDLMRNNHSDEIIENVKKNISLKRIAEPEEIANVVLFLASDQSSYINGQVIRVDGGM